MKLNIEKTVTVITPTVGSSKLIDATTSVTNQTYRNIEHLIVSDGIEFLNKIPEEIKYNNHVTVAPNNTGANGFYGHRIYASYPHLINSDYIAFLDEDNWYDTNHIKTLVNTLEESGSSFAFSLRSIYDENRNFICPDDCESLGKYPIYGKDSNGYLVDTSSYLFKREFLIKVCHNWHFGWGADRRFFNIVKGLTTCKCTGQHSLAYRLDGNPNSPKAQFFLEGNKLTQGYRPWNLEG